MGEPSDESLVAAALEGDDEAFIRLVTRHKRRVIALAARFIDIREDLDDICQDVFMKAYYYLRSYKKDFPFEHWLSRITVNTCYDALRKINRLRTHTVPMSESVSAVADPSWDEKRTREEAHRTLYRGLAKLKAPERLVLTLLELEEKSVRDVAKLTGWTESNVKVRAFRARRALRKILEEQSHE